MEMFWKIFLVDTEEMIPPESDKLADGNGNMFCNFVSTVELITFVTIITTYSRLIVITRQAKIK